MRWFQVLTASLLPFTAFAAKKTGDKFTDARTKSLEIGRPLKLDDGGYGSLTKGQRDFSVAILLTALETRFGCMLCREFQPEWDLLGKSWIKGDKDGKTRTLFGTLDFADGKNTFQSVRLTNMLQLEDHELILHSCNFRLPQFSSSSLQPSAPTQRSTRNRFAMTSHLGRYYSVPFLVHLLTHCSPQAAEQIHAWVSRQLPVDVPKPKISRPINWVKIISVTTAVLGGVTALAVASPYILPLLQNRNVWAAFSLIAVLLFTSGHMFNHIRKTPYVQGDGKGGISYFAGGFSNQFGLESQIVAAIYGVLAFATISLALKVPRIADSRTQQFAVFLWSGVLLCMYSFLLSVFRMKNGGYQFWLPPF